MNYKYYIISIYLLFVSLILIMVFKSCGQNIDLESKNYYNEELKFQSKIDAKYNGNPFIDSFSVREVDGNIVIVQPLNFTSDSIKLEFRKPDKALADRDFLFHGPLIQRIKKSEFAHGIYRLNIRLYAHKKEYLIEKQIKI